MHITLDSADVRAAIIAFVEAKVGFKANDVIIFEENDLECGIDVVAEASYTADAEEETPS